MERYAGHFASAHLALFLYMMIMRATTETTLVVMTYFTGLLSIFLFSSTRETYEIYKSIPLFILGMTSYFSSVFLGEYILRWVPLVSQQAGTLVVRRNKNTGNPDVVLLTSVAFSFLFLILNVLGIIIKL